MTTPLYIFDLDGTLADLKHRRHYVEKPLCYNCQIKSWPTSKPLSCTNCAILRDKFKPNWDAFHAACVNDTLIEPVAKLLISLARSGADIWVWSGRMETVRNETVQWFEQYEFLHLIKGLRMRPAKDYTVDHVLKESWLKSLSPEDRARLVCVFDDRNQVVDMWRRNGVICAQVAPGDF